MEPIVTYKNSVIKVGAEDCICSIHNIEKKSHYKFAIRALETENSYDSKFTFVLLSVNYVNSQVVGPVMDLPYNFVMETFKQEENYENPEYSPLLEDTISKALFKSIAHCIFTSDWFKFHGLNEFYKSEKNVLNALSKKIKFFEDGLYTIQHNVPEKRKLPTEGYVNILVNNYELIDRMFVPIASVKNNK